MPTPSILIIDDSDDFRLMASDLLLDAGYDVWDAQCPHDAFSLLKKEKFDLILCDLHMPFMTGPGSEKFETSYQVGINTIKELKGLFPSIPVVALTSTDPIDLERIKRSLGNIQTCTKPAHYLELMKLVEGFIEHGDKGGMN